jgi:DNA helicase-2/ATP-dependent DNA helicase PcrA
MDKAVIFAVAGSGKTTKIISNLSLSKRALIVTYTNSNVDNLRSGIIRKFGYFPINIRLLSYFNFLYGFCCRPFLDSSYKARGINWNPNPNRFAKDSDRYFDRNSRLYSNRIAKLMENQDIIKDVKLRLEKYFDDLYFDEVQDFGGNDFNFLKNISGININMLLVGDFYQHTFDTSRDGIVNKFLHEDYSKYKKIFEKIGFQVDTLSLNKSYRCSPTICRFISENIGIDISSHRTDEVAIKVITCEDEAIALFHDDDIVKLFYRDRSKFPCFCKNWGECKGEDKYHDVCVVLNIKTWKNFNEGTLKSLSAETKNKLYVACSRPKKNLYFVCESYYKPLKNK